MSLLFCFQCGDMFLQLYTDLCIFALNFDKSCLEKHMQDGDMEGLRNRQQAMASTCEKLATVYQKNDTKIARYSAVTSFALNPSTETLSFVEKFYVNCAVPYVIDRGKQTHDDEKCCTNCFRGEGTCRYKKSEGNLSDANVDVATLLEVERLLNMLRPFYLNPDMKWAELRPLCQRFLHERERLAQTFALEIAETCASDIGSKVGSEPEASSPVTPPAPPTAPPASALTQPSNTTNIQQQVVNENPSYLPQNIQTVSSKMASEHTSKSISGQQNSFPKHVSRPVTSSKQTGPHVIKVVTSQHNIPHITRPSSVQQNVPHVMRLESTEQSVPHVSRMASVQQPVPHVSRTTSVQQTVPHVSRTASVQQTVPHVSRTISVQQTVPHVSRPITVQQAVQHTSRPVSVQQTVQHVARSAPLQQMVPQYITRPTSHQNIPSHLARPVSLHQTVSQHVSRPASTPYISQHAVTRETYSSPISVSSQQSLGTVQQDTSSLVGIEPSVMIRNLLFTNEDISLTDFPDADALVELLQQALPGGGTELPETLQDITMDNTGVAPSIHVVQESVSEQAKRGTHTDSNYVSIYSAPATAQTVQTSLCSTSRVNVTGAYVNATSHNLTHASSAPSFSLPIGSMPLSSHVTQSNSAADVAALLNLEMPQIGIPSSEHSQQKPLNQSLSYVTIVTQAEMVTSSAPSQNLLRSNIPIQPKVTQSRVLRPGVAGVVQQGIGAGQQPVQAMMTTNLQKVSIPSQGPIRMTAVGSEIKHNVVDTRVQSLHLSSLPGKPVVTPKCYPNISSSTEHSNSTVAQNTEQIPSQQQSVSSLIENSLKNIYYQQSTTGSNAGNSELHAQQIVSGTSQKSGHMSLGSEHDGSVQRTFPSLADRKQGESVSVSQELMQNILSGGSVQVLPSPSSMMLSAAGIANILQTSANVASQSPTILCTAAPSSMSAAPSLDINQQTQPGTADISNVIALLNLQSQLLSQANPQSGTKANTTKTLKQVFSDFQKTKIKNTNPSLEKDQVNVKVVPSSSQEVNVKVGTSAEVFQEPILSMHLHGIPVHIAPPPSASVLEQTVTCANDHLQNTTVSAALFQHLQSTQPAMVQQGQQVQHLVGSLSQQLQQAPVTVMPSVGQTQNNLVQPGQTIFIPAATQQTPAALFQPATVGQMTLVHQIPSQTLFGQPAVLQTGINISNISQLSVANESNIKQTNKNVSKSKIVKSSEVSFSANNQVITGDVTQSTTSTVSKAHVPFMLASRLCSSSSKKYNLSSSQSKLSQKTKVNLKDLPATSKAVDYPSFPILSKTSDASHLENFLLNSVLTKQSIVDSGQQQIVHHRMQSADSLHTQSALPSHSVTHISQANAQSLPKNHLAQNSDNLRYLDCFGVKSSSDGIQVPAGFNSAATDSLNSALCDFTAKTVAESVLTKYGDPVDDTLFAQNEHLSNNSVQNMDLVTTDQPYLIENVSSKDLIASKVCDPADEFSEFTGTVPSSNSGISITANDSKSDVQKKRIVSKRLFATKFKCMICSEVFENMDDLRTHVRNPCSPGMETSLEKYNRINACEEALKKSPYSSKSSSDKAPQVTKKSLEASRVYECPVCKVLCKTDEEVLHHRFVCLKSKSKPRSKKPKVPPANISTTTSYPASTSSVMTDVSSAGLLQNDTSFSSGAMSLTTLSPLSLNSGGMVSPVASALVSPVTLTATLESTVSTSVASSLSSTPPVMPTCSGDNVSTAKPVKFVSRKPTKVRRVPHTGLLGTRPKPPPKPMTPERIADLLLVWRTVEWVRAALGVAAPSFRIKALDLARSNVTSDKKCDSQLVEALDIDKSVVPKIKLYEEKQKKMKSKKKKKSSSKADSSLESIASVKSLTKSQPKEKTPPKKKKEVSQSVDTDGSVKKAEPKKTEKSPNLQQCKPVKKKKIEAKQKPVFKVLEHLGRKYYKCGLCGQTFCNLDFMVSEHWEKCLSQNPKQRKNKPGGPGDKKFQKPKANKDIDSSQDNIVTQPMVDANQPMATEKIVDTVLSAQDVESKLENSSTAETVERGVEKKSIQEKIKTDKIIPLSSRTDKINPLSSVAKVDPPHIDFAALLKETFSNALGKRTTDTVNLLDDESIAEMLSSDMMPNQSDELKNDSTSTIPSECTNFLQKSEKILENIQECVEMTVESKAHIKQPENVTENSVFANVNDDLTNMKTKMSPSFINNPDSESNVAHVKPSSVTKPQVLNKNYSVPILELDSSSKMDIIADFEEYLMPHTQQPVEETSSSHLYYNKSVPNEDSLYLISKKDIKNSPDDVLKQLPLSLPDNKCKSDSMDSSVEQSNDGTINKPTQLDDSDETFKRKKKDENGVNTETGLNNADIGDEEKVVNMQTNCKNHVDASDSVDQTANKPSGGSALDEKTSLDELVSRPSRSALDECSSGENTIKKPCSNPDWEKNSNDKALKRSYSTSDENSNSDEVDPSFDNEVADENNKVIKEQMNDNQPEEDAGKSGEDNTMDGTVHLGKKRPVLDRDAKSMNNSSSFMLKQTDDSTGSDVSCDACGALFRHVRTLIQHMVSRHLHPKQWTATATSTAVCPFCDLDCSSYMTYMDHLPKHTTVILEKMRHYLLSDEKKSHQSVTEFSKIKQDKEENSDPKKVQNHSSQDSVDDVNTDVEVKLTKKRGRPKKLAKTDSATEVQNVDNTEDGSVQSDDVDSVKLETSEDSRKDFEDSFPARKTRSKTSKELRQLTGSEDCVLSTRSRKRSLSPISTHGHCPTKMTKLPNTESRSLRREIRPKKGSLNSADIGQRKSVTEETRPDLIKAAQAHIVLKKVAVFTSHNSSQKKQASHIKKETISEKCEEIKSEQERFSRKSYSLRNAAHLYIKSRQSMNDIHKSTDLGNEKKNDPKTNSDTNKRKTSCRKDEKMQSVESNGDANCTNIPANDSDVDKNTKCSDSTLRTPPCLKKLKLQFLKRYDETSICFSKKDNCWQAYDKITKTYKLLSPKHFVGSGKCATSKENTIVTEDPKNSEGKEQLIHDSVEEQKNKQTKNESEVKTENVLTVPVEEKDDADVNMEKPAGLCSPSSFQDSYMSYLCQFSSESSTEDAEVSEADNCNSAVLIPPEKEVHSVKTLQNIVNSESRDVGKGDGKTPSKEKNVCETKCTDVQLMNGMSNGNDQIGSRLKKETGYSFDKDQKIEQISKLTTKSVEEKDMSSSTVDTVLEVTEEDKNSQEINDTGSGTVNTTSDHLGTSKSLEGNNSTADDELKNITAMRQPKSLKVMAAKMQPPKPEVVVAGKIKPSDVAKAETDSKGMEDPIKTESDVPDREKPSHSTKAHQSDTEEDEDDTKRHRIQRSLKSLREKSNVAPFTWDVDEDEHPVSRVSCAAIPSDQIKKPRETVYSRAISVGISPPSSMGPLETVIRTRFRQSGEGIKSEGHRKVNQSYSSESTFNAVSHTLSPSSTVPAKMDFRSAGGKEIKRPVSVGTDQSYRTRSCDQRSSDLNNFIQRKVKLENKHKDDVNNTVCRKRRISRSEESQERKPFEVPVTSKEPVVRAKYGSSRGQQAFSNVAPLPAVVRRNSHRLTSPVYTKSSVSNYQFYRVAPTEESKGNSLRSSRNVKPPYEERTRHTLVVGEHVQSGPQLRNSGGKKHDQKWVIDKRKHKKASFPYAFTRIGNQRK